MYKCVRICRRSMLELCVPPKGVFYMKLGLTSMFSNLLRFAFPFGRNASEFWSKLKAKPYKVK